MKKVLMPLLLLAAASCRDDRPPTPTSEQSDQLNEADQMLNDLSNQDSTKSANTSSNGS